MKDIAMHILDIAYNSIRALSSLITINIVDSMIQNKIEITIQDNGKGMSEETLKQVINPFYTTRTTRRIGLGIPLFKEGVEMTGGKFKITSQLNEGTTTYGCYVKNHLDTPPMGDLCETIITLIQANANIDYLITYQNDKTSFCLDTKEIKKILDGISINEPEIILWLKDYIKEGMSL
ncbi:MAG: sensor histidine kinase [Erysipelotrichaceae bacterium]|nr:sensor histidine kinase [Erysipelotrichaceae bacterium]